MNIGLPLEELLDLEDLATPQNKHGMELVERRCLRAATSILAKAASLVRLVSKTRPGRGELAARNKMLSDLARNLNRESNMVAKAEGQLR